jgi:hypothetical protein
MKMGHHGRFLEGDAADDASVVEMKGRYSDAGTKMKKKEDQSARKFEWSISRLRQRAYG